MSIDGNAHAPISLESCLAFRIEQKRYRDFPTVRRTKKFVCNRDPTGAVELHGSAVPQTKSRDITVVLGDDPRNWAVVHT